MPEAARSLLPARAGVMRTAYLWEIQPIRLPAMYFTDHDQPITFEGQVYDPAGGYDVSASEWQEGLRELNREVRGLVTSDRITEDDIRRGEYKEAQITEYLVDWKYPFAGEIQKSVYWIMDMEWSETLWNAQLTSIASWLRQPIGRIYTKTCRWRLGQDRCALGVSLAPTGEGGITEIGSITTPSTRRVFDTDVLFNETNYYRYGFITFRTGPNSGLGFEIRASTDEAGGGFTRIYLDLVPSEMPEALDQFDIYRGCDKRPDTCLGKFNNRINYGGFDDIPGTDKVIQVTR